MRDPNRIYPFCMELARLWSMHPDMRFGQLMFNIEAWTYTKYQKDSFYIEDDEFMKIIRDKLEVGS